MKTLERLGILARLVLYTIITFLGYLFIASRGHQTVEVAIFILGAMTLFLGNATNCD